MQTLLKIVAVAAAAWFLIGLMLYLFQGRMVRIGRINHVCGHLGNYVCLIRDERNKP
jgi:hypothetical protein